MPEKNKKKQSSDKLTKNERRFGVVLEHIDSKLGLVVEGHKSLDKKIDRVEKDLGEFRQETNFKFKVVQETLDSHSEILNSHSKILDSHSKILDSHSKILNSHTEILNSHTEDIEIIKGDLDLIKNLIKRKVDAEEFEALEKRVLLLERKAGRSQI